MATTVSNTQILVNACVAGYKSYFEASDDEIIQIGMQLGDNINYLSTIVVLEDDQIKLLDAVLGKDAVSKRSFSTQLALVKVLFDKVKVTPNAITQAEEHMKKFEYSKYDDKDNANDFVAEVSAFFKEKKAQLQQETTKLTDVKVQNAGGSSTAAEADDKSKSNDAVKQEPAATSKPDESQGIQEPSKVIITPTGQTNPISKKWVVISIVAFLLVIAAIAAYILISRYHPNFKLPVNR